MPYHYLTSHRGAVCLKTAIGAGLEQEIEKVIFPWGNCFCRERGSPGFGAKFISRVYIDVTGGKVNQISIIGLSSI
jgi:hypothetical protein